MSFKALYRTYRPKDFSELLDQDAISTTLKNALVKERLSHAYLFCGPRGTGKTSSAKILAKAVNCLSLNEGEPCNACANCLAFNEDKMMDVFEIDAASNRGIDEMRELKEQAYFAPTLGKYKVFIIDEVHMLTQEAFNALLKLLEEPPSHVLFILATTDPEKVPLTVLSRVQRFDFRRISDSVIQNHLKTVSEKEGVDISDEALFLIASKAQGGLRDALGLLDQAIALTDGLIEKEAIKKIIGGLSDVTLDTFLIAFLNLDYQKAFETLAGSLAEGIEAKGIITSFLAYLRGVMSIKMGLRPPSFSDDKIRKLRDEFKKVSLEELEILLSTFYEAEQALKFAVSKDVLLELTFSRVFILLKKERQMKTFPEKEPIHPSAVTETKPVARKVEKKMSDLPPKTEQETHSSTTEFSWDVVLQEVNKKSVRVNAFLKPAKVRKDGNTIILTFGAMGSFHAREMMKMDNQSILLEAIYRVSGERFQIKVIEETPKDDTIESEHIKKLSTVFGKDKLEIRKD